MAKGAKRKTKWVSLSLANANTKTSNAAGSDSEQTQTHSHQHNYGEGQQKKMYNGGSLASKASKDLTAGTEAAAEQGANERTAQDHSGNRTDTSTGSDYATGPERPSVTGYHRRRPPPYNARNGWSGSTGGSSNGRNNYHRNGYYGNGGGYYGGGKRSHFDSYTRRHPTAASTNRTTSGDGAETGGTTINDDEYTRITTPRQDVLFKKGYLSRPKPSVTTASTSTNTGSSSIAGTTSEGSDGGNGGSNSISTTESITSEYGGSYAADGSSQLFDYSMPCIPCGYFTEKGVLVMNGFAVDNNGFSYFNGGQTYIYPPNYTGCPQSPLATTNAGDQATDSMLYAHDDTNDEANTIEPTELDRSTPNHSTPVIDTESMPGYGDVAAISCSEAYNESGATGGDGPFFPINPDGFQQVPLCEVVPEQTLPNGTLLTGEESGDTSMVVCEAANESATSTCMPDGQDLSENGYFQCTNIDFTQFYNSLYYSNMLMGQYPLCDDAGLPLYCGSEYAMTNEEVYGQQPSFKKRKKRFRTFEEMPSANGNSYDDGTIPSTIAVESNTTGSDVTDCVPENHVPSSAVCHQPYQLNAEVQEFLPSAVPHESAVKSNDVCQATDKANSSTKSNTRAVPKTRHPVAPKLPKSSSPTMATGAAVCPAADETATVSHTPANGKSPPNKANRKKDLIESTLAFAAQNIDLTRPKTVAAQATSHDSELFWTTIDRNGRKKRVPLVPEQETVTAREAEKESAAEKRTKENAAVGETIPAVGPIQPKDDHTSAVESLTLPVANGASDGSSKKEQQTKSKKKTHKHKRQQLRKSVGNFNKQPLEGFQLIEPEFTSSATGHRRGKSSDKAGRADSAAQKLPNDDTQTAQKPPNDDTETAEDTIKKQSFSMATVVQNGVTDEHCRVAEEQPNIGEVKLNCDNSSNGTSSEFSPSEEDTQEEVEEVMVAQKVVPLLALASALDEKTNVNETETETHHQHLTSLGVEEAQKDEQKAEIAPPEVVENVNVEKDIKQLVSIGDLLKEDIQDTVQCTLEPIELAFDSTISQGVEEEKRFGDDETNHLAPSPPIEEQQETSVQLSVDTTVFTDAAKQLTISSISTALPALEEDHAEDAVDDSIASEGDDTRAKRDSMSGAGYNESIDSGLQSPAPCGGVASPETSSMVSSIESQPAIDLPDVASSQSALSQVVGTWLMRKLEVHEPEEVFVLPSNPLLIQRLERFHQLQRRGRRERLRGSLTSESEGEDQEYDLEDDDDTDSDYMSDGQGRIDRTQSDDASSSNPGSPLNSVQPEADVVQQKPLADAQAESLVDATKAQCDESKRHATHHSDSGSNNSEVRMVARAPDSKRCLIM